MTDKIVVGGKVVGAAKIEIKLGGETLLPISYPMARDRNGGRATRERAEYTATVRLTPDLAGIAQLRSILCWLNIDYAAVLYTVSQIVLAGGHPVDTWDVIAGYCKRSGASIHQIYSTLCDTWTEVTGEWLP